MTRPRHVFYLHGFASSAQSKKAAWFGDRLREHGITLRCPDFNEPEFATLTMTRMLDQLAAEIESLEPGPIALIGSSLGGFVAFHVAARQAAAPGRARTATRPIDRLILLAPALDFGRSGFGGLDAAGLERWRQTDAYEVFHYGENRPRTIGYALYGDAQAYDSAACALPTPTLVFQGRRDPVVDPAMVQRFAKARPAMSLRMLDDDHLLMSSLGVIGSESAAFLGLSGPRA
jgi:hypothetical protein